MPFLFLIMHFLVVFAEEATWKEKMIENIEYELYQSIQQGIGAEWSSLEINLAHVPFKVPSYCSIDQSIRIQFGQVEDFRGGTQVFLEIFNDDSICTRGRFVIYPEIYTDLFVTQETVSTNQDVLYKKKRSRYDKIDGQPVGDGKWIAIKSIASGIPITTTNVREKPLVKDGSNVKVILLSGNIKIHSTGKLLEDGYRNRSARVLLSTGKRVDGIVKDENTVIIHLK